MSFAIDLTTLTEMGMRNPLYISWWIFINGGWTAFVVLFFMGLYILHLERARMKFRQSIKYVLLAIDIPKENEQSLKAVEQIFAQLAAVESTYTLYERYWKGKLQRTFSLELISIEGYIQFLIRTAEEYRDLVEAAIYAQYPEAEITEVGDYTTTAPRTFPDKEYKLWGTELALKKEDAYPIRTYLNFEHTLTQTFADPMASILEALSRLQPGEQVWIQLVLTPTGSAWVKNAEYRVKKLIGAKAERKRGTILTPLSETARGFGAEALTQIAGGGIAETKARSDKELPSKMQFLSPGDRNVVEAIQAKISKIGFKTKIRIIYLAKKEIYSKERGVKPTIGAMMQYNTQNLNAFKSYKRVTTKADYFRVKQRIQARQRRLIWAYKLRANYLGKGQGFVLNIEELASIFHFPIAEITAPLVQKTEIRKGGPPPSLPRETPLAEALPQVMREKPAAIPKGGTPENLPIATEQKIDDESNPEY